MPVHDEILAAAQRLCANRDAPVFTPDEIVRALPHLEPQTVRVHVTSRCCVNAAPHHQSRLAYFRRVDRGRYELLHEHRTKPASRGKPRRRPEHDDAPQRDTIHAIVTKDRDGVYIADCHEIAVVTQGRTLDEVLANLSEAVTLHLEGEDLTAFGLRGLKRIQVQYEWPADGTAA